MTFDSILNKQMTEEEIFFAVAEVLQKNFSKYQGVEVSLLLSDIQDSKVSIIDLRMTTRSLEDIQRKREFLFSGPFCKCNVFSRFKEEYYALDIQGHYMSKSGDVYISEIKHIHTLESEFDFATQELPDFDLLQLAFGEFEGHLKKTG